MCRAKEPRYFHSGQPLVNVEPPQFVGHSDALLFVARYQLFLSELGSTHVVQLRRISFTINRAPQLLLSLRCDL